MSQSEKRATDGQATRTELARSPTGEEGEHDKKEERLGSPWSLPKRAFTLRNVSALVCILVVAKVVTFAGTVVLIANGDHVTLGYLASPNGLSALVHAIGSDWDSVQYQLIAQNGYTTFKGSELYAFSPFYPLLIDAAYRFTGSYVNASLLVTNVLSFAFPLVLLRLFGFRTALLAETFPVYVVFSMVAYSDVLALLFLALGLLFFVERRYLLTGVMVGLAGMVFYDLFAVVIPLAACLVYWAFWRGPSLRRLVTDVGSLMLPAVACGLVILAFYWGSTGNPLEFFSLERDYWGVLPTNPVGQVVWLFQGTGAGSFVAMIWNVNGLLISSAYWAVRNVVFEAFTFFGIFLLARMKSYRYRWPMVAYSLSVSVPLLFVQGTPVYSIPRLLLAAFPAFLGYSAVLTKPWHLASYVGFSLIAAAWVLLTFNFAFFA